MERERAGGRGSGGPSTPTPLSVFFYAAYEASGLTFEEIAARSGLSLPTVAAYINGTRGGRQARTAPRIELIAEALGVDPKEALRLARLGTDPGVVRMILGDPRLPKWLRDKALSDYERELREGPSPDEQ